MDTALRLYGLKSLYIGPCGLCGHLSWIQVWSSMQATSKANGGNGSSSGSGHGTRGNHRGQPKTEDFSLDTALRLYGLERMEVLWERRLDTMALIAWGSNRIVVVFRGTSSLKNVLADLEVTITALACGKHVSQLA